MPQRLPSYLLLALLFFACNYTTPELIAPPKIVSGTNPHAPSIAYLQVEATEPVRLVLEASDQADHRWLYQPGGLFKQNFQIPIFQLRPGIEYEFKLSIIDTWFNRVDIPQKLYYQPPALPEDFPEIKVSHTSPDQRESGFTLFSVAKKKEKGIDKNFGLLVALNRKGEVVWYFHHHRPLASLQQCRTGHILATDRTGYIIELNFRGEVIRGFIAEQQLMTTANDSSLTTLPMTSLVGDVEPNSRRYYVAFAKNKSPNENTFERENDHLIEFNRQGKILKNLPLQDLFSQIGFSNAPFSFQSIAHDPKTGALLIGAEMPAMIARVDRSTDTITWVLQESLSTTHDDFVLTSDSAIVWPQQIQSFDFTPQQTYLVFDEYTTSSKNKQGRILEYQVDNSQKSIQQNWYYDGGAQFPFWVSPNSKAYRLPKTANVLYLAKNDQGEEVIREIAVTDSTTIAFEVKLGDNYSFNGLLHLPDVMMKVEGE